MVSEVEFTDTNQRWRFIQVWVKKRVNMRKETEISAYGVTAMTFGKHYEYAYEVLRVFRIAWCNLGHICTPNPLYLFFKRNPHISEFSKLYLLTAVYVI